MSEHIQRTTWQKDKELLSNIRYQVFVDEQKVPIEFEIDDDDPLAAHILCIVDGQPVGTGRILLHGHIGRLAVLQANRKQGYGNKILEHLELIAQENELTEVFLNAQVTAIPFYEKRGYMIISDVFDDAGIPHQTMRKTL
jgi:predicted GNAT family N-acyltransferase